MMTEKELLVKARALIENPKTWIQGHGAEDSAGLEIAAVSPDAVSFCAIGALDRACFNLRVGFCSIVATAALQRLDGMVDNELGFWNDALGRTHDEVLAAFDRAIADA